MRSSATKGSSPTSHCSCARSHCLKINTTGAVARPIYAGAGWALVRLESGEYVCANNNPIGSIDYLLGWPMEMDYLPAFRRFLRPESVVLDLGANFGLYTAAAGRFLNKNGGRPLFFGTHPHT